MSNWFDPHPIVGLPTASPAAQIRYLRALLQVSHARIETLEMELKTAKIKREIEATVFGQRIDALNDAKQALLATKPPYVIYTLPKKSWWERLWRKKSE